MEHLRGKLTIGCDIIQADKLSEKLVALLPTSLDARTVRTLRLGIREMLINAIEHGSLEIGFEAKTGEVGRSDYMAFLLERQKQPKYAGRKVTVEYHFCPRTLTFRISDEGPGFDHRKAHRAAAAAGDNLDLAHGRGIRMTLRIFDRVRYNNRGNRVTLLKKMPVASARAS